jgi:hypothetical protein
VSSQASKECADLIDKEPWEGQGGKDTENYQAIVPAGARPAEGSGFSGQVQDASLISQGKLKV